MKCDIFEFKIIIVISSNQVDQPTVAPPSRQYPISYIRAFAYHPVAFPQPLAPITTYQVSRNPQTYNPNRSFQTGPSYQAKYIQGPENLQSISQPATQQQPPQNAQVDFGAPAVSSTTTSTTTSAPVTTSAPASSFTGSQPVSQVFTRSGFNDGYQRMLPMQQQYQSPNFGGFPQYYNEPFTRPINPYQFNDQGSSNQFSGRLFNSEPSYQQYSPDPVTYQFIPTSVSPIQNQNVKFVPCMCPVAVSISAPIAEKRTDEIPLLNPTPEPESSVQSSTQQLMGDERK